MFENLAYLFILKVNHSFWETSKFDMTTVQSPFLGASRCYCCHILAGPYSLLSDLYVHLTRRQFMLFDLDKDMFRSGKANLRHYSKSLLVETTKQCWWSIVGQKSTSWMRLYILITLRITLCIHFRVHWILFIVKLHEVQGNLIWQH